MHSYHDDDSAAFAGDLRAMEIAVEMPHSLPTGDGNSHAYALDQDALLEALLFMEDVDLSTAELAPPVETETEPTPTPLGTFSTELFGVIPATAYLPDPSAASNTTSVLVSQKTSPASHALSPLSPLSPSPGPSSPLASVASSMSPPASPSAGSDTTKSTTSACVTKPKGMVNRSRNRRREELHYLRSLVGELEDRLTTLSTRADEQQRHAHDKLIGDTPVEADDPMLVAVWENLASRQYAERQRAEHENTKLRRMLEDQIQVGKSLERLLKRRAHADEIEVHAPSKRPRQASVSTAWNNSAIFDELVASLPPLYDELAAVFAPLCFDRSTPNFRDIQVRTDPGHGVGLDVTEAHVFPFDYQLTAQNYWTLFSHQTDMDRVHYQDMDCHENLLKIQFGLTVQVARASGKVNMKIVSQRYVEANRTVMVWVGFCDPIEISETNMDGIYMRHKGWAIIEPLGNTSTSSSIGTGTRIRSYSQAMPEAFDDVPDQKRKVGTLTNFMLATADVQINARQQQLENRLVALSRGQK